MQQVGLTLEPPRGYLGIIFGPFLDHSGPFFWAYLEPSLGLFRAHFLVLGGPMGLFGPKSAQNGPTGATLHFHSRSVARLGPKKGKLVFPGGPQEAPGVPRESRERVRPAECAGRVGRIKAG